MSTPALRTYLSRALLALAILAVVLSILGGRWTLIGKYGTDVPEWDQWDAEGVQMIVPWQLQHPMMAGIFRPHNEHRVVLTKVVNFGITLANGQWDQRLLATVNAVWPALLASLFAVWGWRRLSRPAFAFLIAGLVVGWAGPLAWQNVFAGFHSQQFFLLLTAWLSISLLPFAPVRSGRWWIGAVCAVLSLGTMGSGFFGPAVVIGIISLRALFERRLPREHWVTLAVCASVVAVGWFTRVEVSIHDVLRAQTFRDFAMTVVQSMRWPADGWWWAALSWLPWFGLCVHRLVIKRGASEEAWVAIGVGGWVMLQLVATGVMRGAGGLPPSPRYVDTLVFGAIANLLAVGVFHTELNRGRNWFAFTALAGWTCTFVTLAGLGTHRLLNGDLDWILPYRQEAAANTRDYLLTQNHAYLERSRIPYPAVYHYQVHLQRQPLHAFFPASIRKPIETVDAVSTGAFVSSGKIEPRAAPNALGPAPGLPAEVPRLGPETTWGSANTGKSGIWKSVTMKPTSGNLRFEVAGTWDQPGVSLQLRDAFSNEVISNIQPAQLSQVGWQPAFVPCPSVPYFIVATDESADGWIAFSSPRQEAWASGLARELTESSRRVFLFGVGLVLATLACLPFVRTRIQNVAA